ncbi:hypothetical protein FRB97_009193 [Tulasnella sp. 331]|nr:hypothetical protein FRB97_009193 [Tulasnella sp. 331]
MQTATQTTQARPTFVHHPHSFHSSKTNSVAGAPPSQHSNRFAYVTSTGQQVLMPTVQTYVPTGVTVPRSMTPGPNFPAVQRVRQEAPHGGGVHRSNTGRRSSGRGDSSAPSVGTPYVTSRAHSSLDSADSEDDAGGYSSAAPGSAYPYGGPITAPTTHVPRIVSNILPTPTADRNNSVAVKPIMQRKRTQSSSSVHFTPDNLFLTFPSPHTMKLSNIPRFGNSSLMRAIREKVITMWLPGVTFQKEGRGEYVVGFAGLGDGAMEPRGQNGHDNGLTEADRKNWGLWTARGMEGIAALRFLTTLFTTMAAQGFSYLASLHCLPPQIIFTTTPADTNSRFLAVEISVSPLPSKKQRVYVTNNETGQPIMTKKVKIDISRVNIRCVDIPTDALRAVVGAVRNSGRDASGLHTGGNAAKKYSDSKGGEVSEAEDEHGTAASELLEFGVQGERWEAKGVYVLESVISRGTGKRALSRKEIARSRAEKQAYPGMPDIIEADTDTLPVLLAHVLKALSSNGYRLETSVPLPLPVPLVDPFSPFGQAHTQTGGGFSSFLSGVLGGENHESLGKGYGREVWMFRTVGWFEDLED